MKPFLPILLRPTQVSLPESHHGIVWEVLEPGHLHKLAALISRMEAQDNPPYRTSTDEVAEMLAEDRTWSYSDRKSVV